VRGPAILRPAPPPTISGDPPHPPPGYTLADLGPCAAQLLHLRQCASLADAAPAYQPLAFVREKYAQVSRGRFPPKPPRSSASSAAHEGQFFLQRPPARGAERNQRGAAGGRAALSERHPLAPAPPNPPPVPPPRPPHFAPQDAWVNISRCEPSTATLAAVSFGLGLGHAALQQLEDQQQRVRAFHHQQQQQQQQQQAPPAHSTQAPQH
jgi:hypothetical protein